MEHLIFGRDLWIVLFEFGEFGLIHGHLVLFLEVISQLGVGLVQPDVCKVPGAKLRPDEEQVEDDEKGDGDEHHEAAFAGAEIEAN